MCPEKNSLLSDLLWVEEVMVKGLSRAGQRGEATVVANKEPLGEDRTQIEERNDEFFYIRRK